MWTIIIFILVLSVLVFVHEFGHFIAARKLGMRVYEFALGFPPMLIGVYRDPKTKKLVWVRQRKTTKNMIDAGGGKDVEEHAAYPATLYSLNIVPLGGFCKIKGENGDEAGDEDSFAGQKIWKRAVVLVCGVLMNVILAAVLLGIGFGIGLPTDVSESVDPKAIIVGEPQVLVQQVEKNSPADLAGMKFGDHIAKINGKDMKTAKEVMEFVSSHAIETLTITIQRGEETLKVKAVPAKIKGMDATPRLGVLLADAAITRYPWHIAIWKGIAAAGIGLINIFVSFYFLLKGLVLGQGLAFDVSGPVGIAVVVGQSARMGLNYLINVTAMISLSLAAINILPIPALDGGRLLFVVLEKILGRPVSMKYEQLAHTVGFVLLLLLIVVITGRDIIGLF